MAAPTSEDSAPAASAWIALPTGNGFGFFSGGQFRVKPHKSGRSFGPFLELTLEVNVEGKAAFDSVCARMGFTQSYETGGVETFTMTKIPVILLVFLMRHDYEGWDVAAQLRGAFPICMAPEERTAMNVIVGRHPNDGGGYALEKFCLYYPENESFYEKYGKEWPLLDGFSFRTAIFGGDIGAARRALHSLARSAKGLTIDDASAYEDAMYWRFAAGEGDRLPQIKSSVDSLVELGTQTTDGPLALSYDPALSGQGISCAQEEFQIFEKELAGAMEPTAASSGLRIQIASDLHLEIYDHGLPPLEEILQPVAPVLALLGDISALGQVRTWHALVTIPWLPCSARHAPFYQVRGIEVFEEFLNACHEQWQTILLLVIHACTLAWACVHTQHVLRFVCLRMLPSVPRVADAIYFVARVSAAWHL